MGTASGVTNLAIASNLPQNEHSFENLDYILKAAKEKLDRSNLFGSLYFDPGHCVDQLCEWITEAKAEDLQQRQFIGLVQATMTGNDILLI